MAASLFAIALGAPPSALATNGYTFDPALSLTGNCKTTELDTVPDPGCPEGKHPPRGFTSVRSIVTDSYGDIYVASYGKEENGSEGRIDIFDPEGFYIGEVTDSWGPKDLALDAKGNLYVFDKHPGANGRLMRFSPTGTYDPAEDKIEYGVPPTVVIEEGALFLQSIAVNPVNGHVFLYWGPFIEEFGNAEEGNKFLEKFAAEGSLEKANGQGLAVDAAHGLVYADDKEAIRVFELAAPHKLLRSFTGAVVPVKFTEHASIAVDESTGNFFVFDGSSKKLVYEFLEDGTYVGTLEWKFEPIFGSELSVDNGPFSPNSGFNLKAKAGYLFAPSQESGLSQSLAFAPKTEFPPEVEAISFANVSEEDAELWAMINPGGVETEYVFEYTTQESFEAEGFAGVSIAGEGQIPAGLTGVPVSASASGLEPETEYRFRVVATNSQGTDEAEGAFATYPEEPTFFPCSNDAVRAGLSALLPDCRAYELVTPPDTNARTPRGVGLLGIFFPTVEVSPVGDKVSFFTSGGTIPGNEGTGSLAGDPYLATRGTGGWSTASAGPTGAESPAPENGSTSPDQGYSFWKSNATGSAAVEGEPTAYIRYPDGHSALVGRGSLAVDPRATGNLISENGSHIIFSSINFVGQTAVQLEPNAPPDGTAAVYDRTADEVTHVVSLLPGNVTPAGGQNAGYVGASLDGKGVAFSIGTKLYLRYNNEETYEAGENVTFAGVAEGGARIFYVKGGDLFAFDAKAEETIRFTEAGNITPVNVAAEGTAAYFVSPSMLTGEEENPNGAQAQAGKENLYLSREGAISFVATVTERDVEGEFGATERTGGLGLWTVAVSSGNVAEDPSRTTPDGNVMLFESRAALAGYDPEGHAEVYRYDSTGNELVCLSCNPTGAPATSDASLQSILEMLAGTEPFSSFALANNLRDDGRRAFFQSSEPLVQGDTDELQDVYEWEAQGVGSCERPGGCIYLISSGESGHIDYLYGVSSSGDDVFFRTSDLLLPADRDETPSIYDARVLGGFPESVEEPCQGEGCRPTITPPPPISSPESGLQPPEGNPPPKHCPKGKHKVTKNGKTRCVKKHHKRRHHRAGSKQGAGK